MLLLGIKRATLGDHNCNLLSMLIREQSKPVLQHFCCRLFNWELLKTWMQSWPTCFESIGWNDPWLGSTLQLMKNDCTLTILVLAPRFQASFYPKHKRMSLHKSLACSETFNQRILARHSFSFSKVYPSPSLSSLPHSMTFLSFKSSRIHRNNSHPWCQNVHLYLCAYVFV